MTPKEKAKELVYRFDEFTIHHSWRLKNDDAIECALIAVDEIIKTLRKDLPEIGLGKGYWYSVKQEIEKL